MTKTIKIEYETAPGTKVNGGYFVPDVWVNVKRKGFIGWLFRLVGSRRGYVEKKMCEALLDEQVAIGRAVRISPGEIRVETLSNSNAFPVPVDLADDIGAWNDYFNSKLKEILQKELGGGEAE